MYLAEKEFFSEPLIEYLKHKGWKLMESGPDIAVLRKLYNNQEDEIVLPRDRSYADYDLRVKEAIQFLAKYEHTSEKVIIEKVMQVRLPSF